MYRKVPKEVNPYTPKLPYPEKLTKKEDIILQNMMDTIKEVKVNISLLSMLNCNPKYKKMIKDLVGHTHVVGDLNSMDKEAVGGHCVTIIEAKLPP